MIDSTFLQARQGKTVVFIDKSNLHYALKEAGWEIDYCRLFNFLKKELEDFTVYYYEGYFPDNAPGLKQMNIPGAEVDESRKEKKFRFFKKLRELGFIVETKPISSVYNSIEAGFNRKCNFDVEITIRALDKISEFDSFVLFSGDGDFTGLIKYLKGRFKKTIVVATKKRTSSSLKKAVNLFINLNTLKPLIERK